jgi:hypothetical protein
MSEPAALLRQSFGYSVSTLNGSAAGSWFESDSISLIRFAIPVRLILPLTPLPAGTSGSMGPRLFSCRPLPCCVGVLFRLDGTIVVALRDPSPGLPIGPASFIPCGRRSGRWARWVRSREVRRGRQHEKQSNTCGTHRCFSLKNGVGTHPAPYWLQVRRPAAPHPWRRLSDRPLERGQSRVGAATQHGSAETSKHRKDKFFWSNDASGVSIGNHHRP